MGSIAKKLNVKERDGEWIEIARSAWDIPKLTSFFGRSYCWAYVCTAKTGEEAPVVCNHAWETGHENGGDIQSVSEDKREYVRTNSKLFRPDWYPTACSELDELGKRIAMLDLVSKHGDTTANPTSDSRTLLANTEAHDLTVDTGPQTTVVAPRVLSSPANSQEEATSVTQPPTPAPLTREDTSSEATGPPVAHSSKRLKLASLASLFLIEMWAGVASLSSAMAELGAPLGAFCEARPLLNSLLSLVHPTSLLASQSEKGEWDIPKATIVWVFGGASCTSLSTADKPLAGKVEDSRCGGPTQRARVFLVWEKAAVTAQLPQWRDSVPAIPTTQQQSVASDLLPAGALPESVWLHGSRVQFDHDTPIKLHKATKAGYVYLLRKPKLDSLAVGDLVAQRKISKGMDKWRVMTLQGEMVELRQANRKHPDFAMVSRSQLIYTIAHKTPLYHPDGIGAGLRRWGKPPLRSGLPEECWRLQGLNLSKLEELQQLRATLEEVASAAGNAITRAMAAQVTTAPAPRYAQHASLILQHRATPYLLPMEAVPSS